jgi:hypothetical protein
MSVAPFGCDERIFTTAAEKVQCPAMTVSAVLDCLIAVTRRGLEGYPGVTCATPLADVIRHEREIEASMDAGLPEVCAESIRLCPGDN